MAHAGATGGQGNRAILPVEAWPVSDEEYVVDPGQRGSQRVMPRFKVSGKNVDTVAKEGFGFFCVAHKNGRPCS